MVTLVNTFVILTELYTSNGQILLSTWFKRKKESSRESAAAPWGENNSITESQALWSVRQYVCEVHWRHCIDHGLLLTAVQYSLVWLYSCVYSFPCCWTFVSSLGQYENILLKAFLGPCALFLRWDSSLAQDPQGLWGPSADYPSGDRLTFPSPMIHVSQRS